jgi:hypothetical protein
MYVLTSPAGHAYPAGDAGSTLLFLWSIMELRDVETFLALSEELRFGRTTRRPHVTRGRAGQTIQALEREIGGAPFERTSRRVRLTGLGRRFGAGARLGHQRLMPSGRPLRRAADDLVTMTGTREVIADDVITLVARGRGLCPAVRSPSASAQALKRSPID